MIGQDRSDDAVVESSNRALAALALVAVAGLAAGPLAAPAAAHGGAVPVTIEGSEDCPDEAYCFEVTNGSLEGHHGGDTLEVTFVNPSSNSLSHNLHVARLADADVGGDTDPNDAYANTEDVSPGDETTIEVQIPAGSDGIYLWCNVGVHESQGMYREVPLGSSDGGTDGGTDGGQNSSPGLGTAAGLAALAGLALATRRR